MTQLLNQSRQAGGAAAPAISLRGVSRSFGDVQAVRGLDLEIGQGEVVAFLGPNGAGKTTTIDMILGLSRPSSGEVRILGREPREAIATGRVSAVMQTGGLLRDLSVRETATLVASLFPAATPVDEVLERAGITDLADRLVSKCSGGEQQRLRFALALLPDPELILLDEPTTGMDVEARRDFWQAIRSDADHGRTVLFATHYLEEADQFADRIILLNQGRIVADGSGPEVRALASGRKIRALLPDAVSHGIAALPGVESIEQRGEIVLIEARDTDAVARHLLTRTPAHDVEITAKGLEEAFLSLTGKVQR